MAFKQKIVGLEKWTPRPCPQSENFHAIFGLPAFLTSLIGTGRQQVERSEISPCGAFKLRIVTDLLDLSHYFDQDNWL
jgi:hypothetical protein